MIFEIQIQNEALVADMMKALQSVWNISLSFSLDCVCLSPFP